MVTMVTMVTCLFLVENECTGVCIRVYMGFIGIFWVYMGLYMGICGYILHKWVYMGIYGGIYGCMGIYGYI